MEKEFSFHEMFVYCLRKWLIIVIAAVIGCAGALTYSVINMNTGEGKIAEGMVSVAGFTKFYPNATEREDFVAIKALYDTQLERALSVMTTAGLKNQVYKDVAARFEAFHKDKSKAAARQRFDESLNIVRGSYYISVSFRFKSDKAEDNALFAYIVSDYMTLAMESASIDEPKLQQDDLISVQTPEVRVTTSSVQRGTSIVTAIALGLVGGAVVGFLLTVVLYFADGKVKSYRDIAALTGGRLIGLGRMDGLASVSPKLDNIMTDRADRAVLATSPKDEAEALAEEFAGYASRAGHRVLLLRFDAPENGAFGDFLSGKDLPESGGAPGVTRLSASRGEIARILPNKERFEELKKSFDRVILCLSYQNDGALACLGAVADSYAVVFDQTQTTAKDIAALTYELEAPEKAIGAVIVNPGKAYVGAPIGGDFPAEREKDRNRE